MAAIYAKTELGQNEIRERAHALQRHSRTLLVLADGTRTGEQLLGMVQGATAADLAVLVEAGLIAETGASRGSRSAPTVAAASAAAPAAQAPAAPPPPPSAGETLPDESLGYRELYDSLNALSKEHQEIFGAMLAGWNDYVREVKKDPKKLPYEFKEWGIEPTEFTMWEFVNGSMAGLKRYAEGGGLDGLNLTFYRALEATYGQSEAKRIFDDVLPLMADGDDECGQHRQAREQRVLIVQRRRRPHRHRRRRPCPDARPR